MGDWETRVYECLYSVREKAILDRDDRRESGMDIYFVQVDAPPYLDKVDIFPENLSFGSKEKRKRRGIVDGEDVWK